MADVGNARFSQARVEGPQSAGAGEGLAGFDLVELYGAASAATPIMKNTVQINRQRSSGSDGNDKKRRKKPSRFGVRAIDNQGH
jgi:hypothetical protein